jgi:hypothetical protein
MLGALHPGRKHEVDMKSGGFGCRFEGDFILINLPHDSPATAQLLFGFRSRNRPRLSDIAFAWVRHQRDNGKKVTVILTVDDAKQAFDWFMQQKFPENSANSKRQESIKALLADRTEKEEVIQSL